jgi:hypothetical protein
MKVVQVENAEIHYIRQKVITDRVRSGYSPEFVRRVARHSTPPITKRYNHLAVEATREPLEAFVKRGKLLENSKRTGRVAKCYL